MEENSCAQYVPQWQEKLGWKLFPPTHAEMPEAPIGGEGWPEARDCLVVRVTINVSWPDRIRLLISGRAIVESKSITEGIIGCNKTNSAAYVLPPQFLDRKP